MSSMTIAVSVSSVSDVVDSPESSAFEVGVFNVDTSVKNVSINIGTSSRFVVEDSSQFGVSFRNSSQVPDGTTLSAASIRSDNGILSDVEDIIASSELLDGISTHFSSVSLEGNNVVDINNQRGRDVGDVEKDFIHRHVGSKDDDVLSFDWLLLSHVKWLQFTSKERSRRAVA
jgi:hypothetical protein